MSGQDEGPGGVAEPGSVAEHREDGPGPEGGAQGQIELGTERAFVEAGLHNCVLYTSPSPRDKRQSRMPSSA